MRIRTLLAVALVFVSACVGDPPIPSSSPTSPDASTPDASTPDASMADAIVSKDAPSPSNCTPAFGTKSDISQALTSDWGFNNDLKDEANKDCAFAVEGLRCNYKTIKTDSYRTYQTSAQDASRPRHWIAEYVVDISRVVGEWVISQFRAGSAGAAQIRLQSNPDNPTKLTIQLGSSAGSRPITSPSILSYGLHTLRVELDVRDGKYSAIASVDGVMIGTLADLGPATPSSDLVQIGPFYEPLMTPAGESSIDILYTKLLVQTCP
jgi:hypothetical protein